MCNPAQVQKLAHESVDFGRFIKDPTISREQKAAALASISSEMKLSELTSRFIGALPLALLCACCFPPVKVLMSTAPWTYCLSCTVPALSPNAVHACDAMRCTLNTSSTLESSETWPAMTSVSTV